jgi:Fur family peroxide stress response transcriptional regulator
MAVLRILADSDDHPIPHLICVRCQEIIDAPVGLVEDLVAEVAHRSGYAVMGQQLDFYGVCPSCQPVAART